MKGLHNIRFNLSKFAADAMYMYNPEHCTIFHCFITMQNKTFSDFATLPLLLNLTLHSHNLYPVCSKNINNSTSSTCLHLKIFESESGSSLHFS